jgi:hypothetical protein
MSYFRCAPDSRLDCSLVAHAASLSSSEETAKGSGHTAPAFMAQYLIKHRDNYAIITYLIEKGSRNLDIHIYLYGGLVGFVPSSTFLKEIPPFRK